MRCEEIMKKSPECVVLTDDCKTAAIRMRDSNIGFLPVCDDTGKVIGTVTDRDLAIRLVASSMPASTSVGDVVTREVVSCGPQDDVREAERRMAREQKSRMLVIDATGKLLGVFSLSDVAQVESDSGRTARTLKEVSGREVRPT